MNCEKCQELLSDYLDGTLGGREHADVCAHMEACLDCADAREEFESIITTAGESREYLYELPNERALWMRIRNTIEADARLGRPDAGRADERGGFWSRLFTRRWEFTLPQLATGVAALAVAVSLVTTLGVQYLDGGREPDAAQDYARRKQLTSPVYPQGYLQPHQASLNYWQQRVELRKASWNPRMRDSFDRSIRVLDASVNESLIELRQNPHDEVAEEVLNSALRDKIELLREFGEQ